MRGAGTSRETLVAAMRSEGGWPSPNHFEATSYPYNTRLPSPSQLQPPFPYSYTRHPSSSSPASHPLGLQISLFSLHWPREACYTTPEPSSPPHQHGRRRGLGPSCRARVVSQCGGSSRGAAAAYRDTRAEPEPRPSTVYTRSYKHAARRFSLHQQRRTSPSTKPRRITRTHRRLPAARSSLCET